MSRRLDGPYASSALGVEFNLWLGLTAILLGAGGCLKAERLVAVQLGDDAGVGDSAGDGASFSGVTLITGLRSDTIDLHDPSLTGDELEIYLSAPSDSTGVSDIWMSTRTAVGAPWKPAVMVSELSSAGSDLDPDVSLDGLVMYLSSDRIVSAQYRLYVSRRASRALPWDAPEAMAGLGDSQQDLGPSVDPGGLYMVFASQRGTSDIRLFSATRTDTQAAWENVGEMTGINSGHQDQNPALFDHALSLIWSSRRSPGVATSDLFQTSRPTSATIFSGTVILLDSLRTADYWEGDPWVSQDGHHIVFVSDRDTGVSQIYEAWR